MCWTGSATAAVAVQVPLQGLFEHFNDGAQTSTAGWTVTKAGGRVEIEPVPSQTNWSAGLSRERNDGEVSAIRAIGPLSGRVVVEARVMSDDREGRKELPAVLDGDGVCVVEVGFEEGNIVCSDGNATRMVRPFEPGEWYVVRMELDTGTGTYDLYVDAVRRVDNATFRTPARELAAVRFSVKDGAEGRARFDNLIVYDHASRIGAPPEPVFDVTKFGAVGDGKTDDTAAIQKAVDRCAGSGGSVYLPPGIYISGTIELKGRMTFFVDPDATLRGSVNDDDYPRQVIPGFKNPAIPMRKALLFAKNAKDLRIDGGGTIDGSGWHQPWRINGRESTRPMLIFPVRCDNMVVQNVYLKDAAVWCFVPSECDDLLIRNVYIDSRTYGNRDGIDIVDCHRTLIEHCTLNTDDDVICPKSGIRRGVDNLVVRHCNLMGSERANGIKFGTLSYGGLKNSLFEDIMIKDCDKAAIALEAVDGADIEKVVFRRIEITDTNSPFYVIIGTRGRTPEDDRPKMGAVRDILFEDITARDLKYNLGCPISGVVANGRRHVLRNLVFRRCDMEFKGGLDRIPNSPPEMRKEYPECNIWGPMPAFGFYIRHADGVLFEDCRIEVSGEDARKGVVTSEVKNLRESTSSERRPPIVGAGGNAGH